MRVTSDDMNRMRLAESQIMDGRRTSPNNFYLERMTYTGKNPVTGVKEYSSSLEMAQPTVNVLKGDEKEVISGGMQVVAGDLICGFSHAKNIPRSEPSSTGDFYYDRVKYLAKYFQILSVKEEGLGDIPNRKTLYAKKET